MIFMVKGQTDFGFNSTKEDTIKKNHLKQQTFNIYHVLQESELFFFYINSDYNTFFKNILNFKSMEKHFFCILPEAQTEEMNKQQIIKMSTFNAV